MRLLSINPQKPEKDLISCIAKGLNEGKVIIYPTDTVYGLGCSIDCDNAVKRIFEIKERGFDKPLSVAFADLSSAKKYVAIDTCQEEFIKKHLREPATFIVPKKNISDLITAGKDTVGIRLIDCPVVKQILKASGVPLITTSANLSGGKPPASFQEIDIRIIEKTDISIDSGPCRTGVPSKIFDARTGRILRNS